MKISLILLLLGFPTILYASSFIFNFESKDIVLLSSISGEKIIAEEVVVYRWYDYPCILDGSRPSTCTEGDSLILNYVNGEFHLDELKMKKMHFINKNPRIGIQVTNHGLIWMSLDDFNQKSNPLELKFN